MKFAVIENEFGEIGIDEKVLSENVDEEVIEVMNGCICCTVRGDLVQALKRLHKRIDKFDGVIIETTGLADPAPVAQTFFVDEDISAKYSLDSIITVVDSKVILDRLKEEKPDGVENEAVEQICFADKVLLNKIDLSDDDTLTKIEKELRTLNPTCNILRCQYAAVSPKELLNIKAFELKRVLDFDPEFLAEDAEHQHDETVTSVSCKIKGNVNHLMLESWIQRLITEDGANLYRYKGIVAVKGFEKKFIFQGVGMLFNGQFSDQSWTIPEEERESVFVFIGKNLDHDWLRDCFKACLQSKELRFKVGDKVQCNIGVFADGIVIKQWDEGNAYRVEVQDSQKTNVWAPIDVDTYIRAPK
jgi:G3E family GTPase